MNLRWYQTEAVEAVWRYWQRGGGHPLIELPTGSGKSLVLGEIVRRVREKDATVVVVTHRKELIAQDERAILARHPKIFDVGVYSAGLNRREVRPCTIAGVQSIYRRAKELGHRDVIIIDEAHLVPPSSDGQYNRLLGALLQKNPAARIVGLTATPYRMGQGLLTEGEDALFDSIVYRAPIHRLVEDGFLAPMTTIGASTEIDTRGLRTERGDFVLADLEMAADVDSITDAVAADIAKTGRRHVVVFGVSVAHAARLRNAIRMQGISCESVTGDTPKPERARILGAFVRGDLACITSCDVLTTGFDAPLIDLVVLVRPTQSAPLYVQIVGRGMRTCEGKTDCMFLDYGGNIARHGPIDRVEVKPKQNRGGGEAPYKVCPECYACCATAVRVCPECDYEFPPPERAANERASRLAVLAGKDLTPKPPPKRHCVESTSYNAHPSKASGKMTMRADYVGKSERTLYEHIASEYVCLEHDGFARHKAEKWWKEHGGADPVPATVEEALDRERELLDPEYVWTQPDGKYVRVTKCEFAPPDDVLAIEEQAEVPHQLREYDEDVYEMEEDELPF
jgi:DNA repair protein RadD